MAVTALHCLPCITFYRTVEVGPNFQVKIEDGGLPVSGLDVELYQGDERKAAAKTDKDGLAFFRFLGPGSYFLGAPADAGNAKDLVIKVNPNGPGDTTIPVRWPSATPIRVRSLKGRIRGPNYRPGVPQERLPLDLLEGLSGRKLRSLSTSEKGEFAVDEAAPGLYFLRLMPSHLHDESGNDILGTIPVAVDSGAPADQLDIDVGQICGLWWVDQGKCPRNELRSEALSGQILDASGAAIPGARISLYDHKDALVDRVLSDDLGNFASPRRWAGSYLLTVNAPGFSPLRTTVNIEPSPGFERFAPLKVQLGVLGACSSAEIR